MTLTFSKLGSLYISLRISSSIACKDGSIRLNYYFEKMEVFHNELVEFRVIMCGENALLAF